LQDNIVILHVPKLSAVKKVTTTDNSWVQLVARNVKVMQT